jgi:hypothetical protein
MTTGATGQLGLALPVQGELSGTWGDTVNNGITQYTNIAIAATLTLTGDGAVTLANTTGDASASNITSTLTGAGTVTAQFAIVRVTGTLTVAKVVTAPSYSKTYIVVNAATGGIVTFKASGQTGVSIAVGESASVYYNGTDYVKVSTTTFGTGDVVGPASATANGIALFNSTTGKLIKDSAASDGLIYGLTVGRGAGAVANNTAVGASALATNSVGVNITAIGKEALYTTTGSNNTAVGAQSAKFTTTGTENSSFGLNSLYTNTTGANNVALGKDSLFSNTTASNNTAVGYQAGFSNTTGTEITAVGKGALYANTTGNTNSAFGLGALTTNTTGADNSGLGAEALRFNTTGNYNTAIGKAALSANTTASNNTAVGYQALYTNTTAGFNTALGIAALQDNTTGAENTAVGGYAARNVTTGNNNVAVGVNALDATTTASNNTAVGYQAGYTSTGQRNAFFGSEAGYSNTTGESNTYIGRQAGYSMTTGVNNTIIGKYSGNQGGLDIRTASNYIVLSDGDGNPRMYSDGSGVLYDQNGKLRAVPQSGSSKTSSYTLATTDVGEYILLGASGAIVIPDATFAAGDVVTIFNNTASTATITCSITTAYIAGTFTDKATMTLAAAGVATVLFITSTLCVVSGNVT